MKVKVRAFLTMKDVIGGQSSLELDLEEGTILSILEDLGKRFGASFVNQVFEPSGRELSGQVLVLLNGRNYSNLPEGLNTPLQDGDEVAIFPPIAGG
jgi:molybdopterin synthase sulfur carrier subunit